MTAMRRTGMVVTALLLAGCTQTPEATPRWWKGNTHTHTLWSDGDGAPELVTDWYRRHGYHFLVLSDHNVLSVGERWFPIADDGRLTPARVEALRERFGPDSVELRETDTGPAMRLKTLTELKARFARPGEFMLIQGEEITDSFERRPVHVNGLHLAELIPPQGGTSVRDTMQRNVDAVIEHGHRHRRPTLAHVNHPNFGWAMTPEDVAAVRGERFFEVYNGHPSVRNEGDETHPSMARMWDMALTARLAGPGVAGFDIEPGLGVLYGLAVDDAHAYHGRSSRLANPGRGWVMVRAPALTPEAIIAALQRGDFYASSGVRLHNVHADENGLAVHVEPATYATYVTRFIGTRMTEHGLGPVGEVLHETTDNPAAYRFRGDEIYVRAVVTSSIPHPNPYAEGDFEQAWVQPVVRGE
jgi:hypothetical protein